MRLLPSGDRPFWGSCYAPLLPVEWRRGLDASGKVVTIDSSRRSRIIAASRLTDSDFLSAVHIKWEKAPIEVAEDLANEFASDESNHIWLDHPVISGVVRRHADLAAIPFLRSTWARLGKLDLTTSDIAYLLGTYSFLEVLQVTCDMRSALDLVITGREWVIDCRVAPQVVPSREDIFRIAGIRHVAMAGLSSQRLETDAVVAGLASRAGIHPQGKHTLDEVGKIIGVTRERVRQLSVQYDLEHNHRRNWLEVSALTELLKSPISDPNEVTIRARLAEEFRLTSDSQSLVSQYSAAYSPCGKRLARAIGEVRRLAWQLSDGTGFFRLVDLDAALITTEHSAEFDVTTLVEGAVDFTGLPYGYGFTQTSSRSPWTVETSLRVLSVVESLTSQQLYDALIRRARGRQCAFPPPPEVLQALYERHPDFAVVDDAIYAAGPSTLNEDTVQAWICEQIRKAGGVLHRATLLELARTDGLNPLSVNVYAAISSPFIRPVGQGCYAIVGSKISSLEIEIARQQARLLSIPTRKATWTYDRQSVHFSCLVGNGLLDSGLISCPIRLRRMIGGSRLRIHTELGQHGHVAVSTNQLFGLGPALTALGVTVGDAIKLTFDLEAQSVTVELGDDVPG